MIHDVLISPNKFFKYKARDDINLKIPFTIVVSLIALMGVTSFVALSKLLTNIDVQTNVGILLKIGFGIGILTVIFIGLLFWIIEAGIFHIIALFFGGEGNYRKQLELIGYAYVPNLILTLIGFSVWIVYLFVINPTLSFENPQIAQKTIESIPIFKAMNYIGQLFTLWNFGLSILAVKEAHKLSSIKSLITVSIPVLIIFMFLK